MASMSRLRILSRVLMMLAISPDAALASSPNTFGIISTTLGDPRQMQFAVKLSF